MAASTAIDKVYFMIHPCSWAASEGGPSRERQEAPGFSHSDWYSALNWEVAVNGRQHELIDRIGPNEVLVIFPTFDSRPMRELVEHGKRALGARCIVCRPPTSVPLHHEPKVLHEMTEPIRHFLEDAEMEGREAFWDFVPPELRERVAGEARAAGEAIGYDWPPSALNLIAIAHMYAQEISVELERRGLAVDPSAVEAEAFGEGFEQCAMNWKSMIPGHLNWARPIENNFDLSVSGAQVLFDATLRERVSLDNDIRLFLWERSHGLPLGLFARARAGFTDPSYDVQVPLDRVVLEAWGVRDKMWPGADSPLEAKDGRLSVPVLSGTARRPNETCYLIGCDVTYEEFRDILVTSSIAEVGR